MTNSLETLAPPPGLLVAGRYQSAAGYHVRRPGGTRDWLVTLTHGGAGRYRLGAYEQICRAGDLVVLAPGAPHDYATAGDQPWEFSWAHFTPRPHWSVWLRLPEAAPGLHILTLANSGTVLRAETSFVRLLRDSQRGGAFHEELALNALEEILILMAQQQAQPHPQLDSRVELTLQRLADSIAEPLSITELARAVATSPSRLAHLFKAQVGEPIARTHLKLRLRQAARLLEFTSRSVGEIAQDVGFQSPFYFSRQFKAYYGCSPIAYRRQLAQRATSTSGWMWRAKPSTPPKLTE